MAYERWKVRVDSIVILNCRRVAIEQRLEISDFLRTLIFLSANAIQNMSKVTANRSHNGLLKVPTMKEPSLPWPVKVNNNAVQLCCLLS